MLMYKIAHNRILRLITVLMMVLVMLVVPTENKWQEAKTAYAIAIADDVVLAIIVGVLIGMGLWSTYNIVSPGDTSLAVDGLRRLAAEIRDNIPEVASWALTISTGINVRALINVPTAIYQLIKAYLDNRYAEDINDISSDADLFSVPGTIMVQGQLVYCLDALEGGYINSGLSEVSDFNGTTFRYEVDTYDDATGLFSISIYTKKPSSSVGSDGDRSIVKSPAVDVAFYAYYKPGVTLSADGIKMSVQAFYNNKRQSIYYDNYTVEWASTEEYAYAMSIISGDNGIRVDEEVYNGGEYAPYLTIWEELKNYVGQTSSDISSLKASVDGIANSMVNSSARTLTWTGDIPDCPIDDLKPYLAGLLAGTTAVIGNWTCQWQESGTLCDISVTDTTTGELIGTASIDVGLSWADILEKTGVGTDTAVGEGAIAGTATGELTLPNSDSKLNLKPLELAGDLFTTRFPFSLPWDIYHAFTMFKVGSETTPVITLPIKLGEYGDYSVDIDLEPFSDTVIPVVKWSTYLGFLVMLIVLTNNLIGRG